MPVYEYKGLTTEGRTAAGLIDADNVRAARQKLRRSGIFPVEVMEEAAARPGASPRLRGGRVPSADLAVATRQLATLVGAGLPLMEALDALVAQIGHPQLKRVFADLRERLREGASMAQAVGSHPRVFSPVYVHLVRAGEASGTLDRMLTGLALFLEQQARLRSRILTASTYPLFMLAVSVLVLSFLIAFVIPQILTVFRDTHQVLPLPTRILLAISEGVRYGWWIAAGAAVGAGIWVRRTLRTERGRMRFDRWRLGLPVFGRLFRLVALSRFASTLGTLLAGGVDVIQALEIAGRAVNNAVLEEAIEEARREIQEGHSIAEPLRRSGVFPPLLTQMVAVGERSGRLEEMLAKAAEAYDQEVETMVGSLTALLGPVMILGMGLVVLFIVLAVLLPIFEMSQIVR